MRLLIGTLYTGEQEYEACLRAVAHQRHQAHSHFVVEGLPDRKAHDRLYQTFMSRSSEFDLFLKLDADMVLKDENSLSNIVALFQASPDLDHLQMAVRDWYSDSLIMGIHAFSNRAHWQLDDALFVDPAPVVPGRRQELWVPPAPLVTHSPDPSPLQAFRFGIHRAAKVVQQNTHHFRPTQAALQWEVLTKTWGHFTRSGDRRLGLAAVGAEQVLAGAANYEFYSSTGDDKLAALYQHHEGWSADEIHYRLRKRWQPGLRRNLRYRKLTIWRLLTTALHRPFAWLWPGATSDTVSRRPT